MKKIIILSLSVLCMSIESCDKSQASNSSEISNTTQFSNAKDVENLLKNSEWADHYVVDHYIYFDQNGNIYTNYMTPGNYNAETVLKYRLGPIKFITADNGEQSATFDIGNEYSVHLSAKHPDEMMLLDTSANGNDAIRIIKKIK